MKEQLVDLIRGVVRDLTGIELSDADFDRGLDDLGLDSIVLVDIVCELEEYLQSEFDENMLQALIDCQSLGPMIDVYDAAPFH